MIMSFQKKHRILILLTTISAAIILMAAGLPSLELRPGGRLPLVMNQESESHDIAFLSPFFRIIINVILMILGILIPLSIIYHLGTSKGRWQLVTLLGIILVLLLLKDILPLNKFHLQIPNLNIRGLIGDQGQLFSQDDMTIPKPPRWLVFGVSFGLSSLILAGSVLIWRRLRRQSTPLELVAQEAQKALDGLQAGVDLKEGVIRCYYEMSQALSERRGLKRENSMTPREFENYLGEMGLSRIHIRRLTRLFEKARYGAMSLGESEEREATSCLAAIVKVCEGGSQ